MDMAKWQLEMFLEKRYPKTIKHPEREEDICPFVF